jgi:hypothetical protein
MVDKDKLSWNAADFLRMYEELHDPDRRERAKRNAELELRKAAIRLDAGL